MADQPPREEVRFNDIDPLSVVEHCTVREFMRRVPHRWSLEDMFRLGDKVKRSAEALQIAFVTTTDPTLGLVRVYPLPMVRGIYDVLAAQFGWPKIIDAEIPGLPGTGGSTIRTPQRHERMRQHLRSLAEVVEDEGVHGLIAGLLDWIEEDLARMAQEAQPASPTPPSV